MDRKKIAFALSMLFASSAMAMPEIKATPTKNGAWIEITDNGVPISSVIINDNYVTDDNGRAFIPNQRHYSSTVHYHATTPDGEQLMTRLFLAHTRYK